MNALLARIAATTPESLEGVRSDFDDLPKPVFVRRAVKDGARIIDATAGERSAAAKARAANRTNDGTYDPTSKPSTAPLAPVREMTCLECQGIHPEGRSCTPNNPNPPSEAQIHYIGVRLGWLREVDPEGADKMQAWLDRGGMATLTGGRGGSASDLITRIKNRTLEFRAKAIKAMDEGKPLVSPLPVVQGQLPVKTDKAGKPMPLYYAVGTDEDAKFYRIKLGRKPGFYFVDVQASADFHPIKNAATKATIVQAIIDAGAETCMARYGQLIGRCGRCGRTLTDPDSRTAGIGPDCRGKM